MLTYQFALKHVIIEGHGNLSRESRLEYTQSNN